MSVRRHRVLVVVTDSAKRAALTRALRFAGYTVSGAATFPTARNRLLAHPPDVLISDIRLRAYNGLHLVVRKPKAVKGAIVMDTQRDPVLAEDALRLGAVYLVKPVRPTQVCRQVSWILDGVSPATVAERLPAVSTRKTRTSGVRKRKTRTSARTASSR